MDPAKAAYVRLKACESQVWDLLARGADWDQLQAALAQTDLARTALANFRPAGFRDPRA